MWISRGHIFHGHLRLLTQLAVLYLGSRTFANSWPSRSLEQCFPTVDQNYFRIKIPCYFQDKLAQVKDARAALEALREEERERKRREAEEAEKLRQRSSSSHVFTIPDFTNFFFTIFFKCDELASHF